MDVWDELEDMLERFDGDFHVDIGSSTMWGGQLRLTLTNPPQRPARSIAFYSVAGASPEAIARRVLDDAVAWLADAGQDARPLAP